MITRHTFSKSERLCSKNTISALFDKGEKGFVFPFRYVYQTGEFTQGEHLRLLISVAKRYHKRANKRNTIKRKIRESYRLNNHELKTLLESENKSVNLALMYCSKDVLEYKTIENAVKKIFENISQGL